MRTTVTTIEWYFASIRSATTQKKKKKKQRTNLIQFKPSDRSNQHKYLSHTHLIRSTWQYFWQNSTVWARAIAEIAIQFAFQFNFSVHFSSDLVEVAQHLYAENRREFVEQKIFLCDSIEYSFMVGIFFFRSINWFDFNKVEESFALKWKSWSHFPIIARIFPFHWLYILWIPMLMRISTANPFEPHQKKTAIQKDIPTTKTLIIQSELWASVSEYRPRFGWCYHHRSSFRSEWKTGFYPDIDSDIIDCFPFPFVSSVVL